MQGAGSTSNVALPISIDSDSILVPNSALGNDHIDEAYGSGSNTSSAFTTIASTDIETVQENGRTYHGGGSYWFPNDETENSRQRLMHHIFRIVFNGRLYFAPIETDGAKVIDLGTGTGIWAIEFADCYQEAFVRAVDISPMQEKMVPPNLDHIIEDVELDWMDPENYWDYVHTRNTIQAFQNRNLLFQRAFLHLKPGGWMECQEIDHFPKCHDGKMAVDNELLKFCNLVADGLERHGVKLRETCKLKDMMRAAGFVNIVEQVFHMPIGSWPESNSLKKVGWYWQTALIEGLEATALAPLIKGLGWKKDEVDSLCERTRTACLDMTTHMYMPFYIVYGQKPFNT
ncbi:uncharacterized protein PV09_09642 [Verruconis gallopava]|uniref:Methyltransferase domain-containing protein n=1 Tax=Verruconis gallopava TaxID=253628 RepID=A0A0D1YD09_9PEZI|nr:uncharacterized protein PV09_09642 [Verruconis gallopava]KIV98561.1 hypothetical protein PV09_09642 [Verruconis gallopava]